MSDRELFKQIFPSMNIDGMSNEEVQPLFDSNEFTMAKLNYFIKKRPIVSKIGWLAFKTIELWKTVKERLRKFIS